VDSGLATGTKIMNKRRAVGD